MTKKKEIAKRQKAGVPSTIDMQADAGAGMEGADKESYALPFLIILQKQSPQIDNVVGAKAGQFFNTVTEELFDECIVIPCGFQRSFIQWAPRDEGGGFKGQYNPIEIETGNFEKNEKGFPCIGDDTLADTRSHFILVKGCAGTWAPAVLSLSSTQIKKSKRWMSQISSIQIGDPSFNPPSFSHTYKLTTVKEENNMGKWFGVKIEIGEMVNDLAIYALAKVLNKQVTEGSVKSGDPSSNDSDKI